MATVYLSSTYEDLKDYRRAAFEALRKSGHHVIAMEDYVATDQRPVHKCLQDVRQADIYVGLFAFRYGYIPPPEHENPRGLSITELEFRYADGLLKPCLTFVVKDTTPWPRSYDDARTAEDKGAQIEALRQYLLQEKLASSFSTPDELSTLVLAAVSKHLKDKNKPEFFSIKSNAIEWPEGKSPYPGLEWFDHEYASLYCGRDREIDAVVAKMCEPNNRFLIISGTSGSGKSSLVGAGVWRAVVHEERLPGSRNWRWCRMQPGDGESTPFQGLAWGLKQSFTKISERPDVLAHQMAENSQTLPEILKKYLDGDKELVLCVDQLEEVFTRNFKNEDISKFLDQLIATSQDTTARLRVLTTVRSDFLPQLEDVESVLQLLNAGSTYHLGPISPLALAEMITKPARTTGYEFEPGLVEDMLREAALEPGNLPLVAYTLKQLFERREGQVFTQQAYQSIGGVAGAVGTKGDQVVEQLGRKTIDSFDRVFAELVHIEREGPPTRKRAVLSVFNHDDAATELIKALTGPDCRILITGRNEQGATVEVAHEKLFSAWPRLRNWVEQSKRDLREIDHAREEACRWQERGERAEELWPISRATEVLNVLTRFGKSPSPELQRFLSPQAVLIEQLEQDNLTHKQRAIIGWKLSQFGDTRSGVGVGPNGLPDIAWIEIPGGPITLEGVQHTFMVQPFRLAKYPVTNFQFQAFVDDGGYDTEDWWKGINRQEAKPAKWSEGNCPREMVSWEEAIAFCRWLSARTGTHIRLPTEWEWQQAATGGELTNTYPWGKGWDPSRCNSLESELGRTTPVGIYPNGATRQGIMDLTGNVREWCLNTHQEPEKPEAVRVGSSTKNRSLRGSSWLGRGKSLQTSTRDHNDPGYRYMDIGFRLSQDIQ